MEIILHYPTETPKTKTKNNVKSFELEFGPENTVHIEYKDGETEEITSNGLTVTGATLERPLECQ